MAKRTQPDTGCARSTKSPVAERTQQAAVDQAIGGRTQPTRCGLPWTRRVANAVGAAIAQISGEVDQIYQGLPRDEALARAHELAVEVL